MFRFFTTLFLGITTLFSGVTHHATTMVGNMVSHTSTTSSQQIVLSQDQLLQLASNKYANGNLPLGDNHYTTDAQKKGYIYLCHAQQNPSGGGAQHDGSWIHGNTWNINEKISVTGKVAWKNAQFSNTLQGDTRTVSGNDLPSHTTGMFPIQQSDPAHTYDGNPNFITAQSFTDSLPTNPTYSDTPYCMGGEAGVMLTGVALFNGFDAELRDAAAHEVQDSCDGHPEKTGEYHYHSLSSCITDVSETTVIGYALDGFPITGPKVATNKYLTTDTLDECHGITSQIVVDGKEVTMYHYVMTQDFPYSISCFRGKPVSLQVISNRSGNGMPQGNGNQQNNARPSGTTQGQQGQMHPQPPQEALTACSGKTTGVSCSFTGPRGTVQGACQTPLGQPSVVCVPAAVGPEQGQQQSPQMQ